MSWEGESIRHSLARRGIHLNRKPWGKIYDVRGLEELVNSYVAGLGVPKDAGKVSDFGVEFSSSVGWELVVDASRLLDSHDSNSRFEKGRKNSRMLKAAILSAPAFVLSYDGRDMDSAYVFVGKGGTFMHPPLMKGGTPYKDNNYLQPIAYLGQSIVFEKPVTLYATTREPDTNKEVEIPFKIAGLVGLEAGVRNEAAAAASGMKLERQLAAVR